MSEAELWTQDIGKRMEHLTKPTLMIHADHTASGKDLPKTLFAKIPATEKKLVWLEDKSQFAFYEAPITIDETIGHIASWFR